MTARPFRRLCRAIGASLVVAALAFAPTAASAQTSADVYINEINYDTPGVDDIDSDERIQFVEIVAPAGFDTAGFSLVIYDGSDGTVFGRREFPETEPGSTVFPDQVNGFGFLAIKIDQPDGVGGVALVDAADAVVQFLSYEGSFTATEGEADGLTSVQIPLNDVDQPAGETDRSLQLVGDGTSYADFNWTNNQAPSPNRINTGQSIDGVVNVEDGEIAGLTLALYPNPSVGRVTVDFAVPSPDHARVSVYDALGREVAVLHDGPVSGQLVAAVEAGRLAPGTYVVRAVTPVYVLTRTLSVVR